MTAAATVVTLLMYAITAFVISLGALAAIYTVDGIAKRRAEGKPVLDLRGFLKQQPNKKQAKASA
jgi:hypothetical protein